MMKFFLFLCVSLYAVPFLITASMHTRRSLTIAVLALIFPAIAIIIYIFREMIDPDHHASSIGVVILFWSLALVCAGLISGATSRLILLRRQAVVASPRVRAGIMLGCFSCLPVLLAVLVI
ncbi:hypothetical protein [Undibacterium sp. TC9W]|uniref:hypothetical protein n=1 Tax=Undibacterium sp. TC9W TaxID=3413053 RepID=UPI003BF30978